MPATYLYELFDLDAVERAFHSIVSDAVSTQADPVQVLKKRQNTTTLTPRVEINLKTQQVQGRRHLLNPNLPTQFQPLYVWNFILEASVTTNRQQNNDQHIPITAKTRTALQLFQLANTWTLAIAPFHTVIDIQEQPIDLGIDSEGDLDTTKMTFAGMLCIRDDAWPLG